MLSAGIAAVFAAISAIGLQMGFCPFNECCRPPWVTSLESEFHISYVSFAGLYGQPLAVKTIKSLSLMRLSMKGISKPLVLSFHGPVGVGKSHLSYMIAELLFQKGRKSQYVHFYNAGHHFPNPNKVYEYRETIIKDITSALAKCERSVFIFDEFDQIPNGIQTAIIPFLDSKSTAGVISEKAVFVFISNTGSKIIAHKTYELSKAGINRNDFRLKDFEMDLMQAVYNEESSWKESPIVKKDLIDAYIPFLPLERDHVRDCIITELIKYNETSISPNVLEEIMDEIPFSGAETDGLYAVTGCRRVASVVSRHLSNID